MANNKVKTIRVWDPGSNVQEIIKFTRKIMEPFFGAKKKQKTLKSVKKALENIKMH